MGERRSAFVSAFDFDIVFACEDQVAPVVAGVSLHHVAFVRDFELDEAIVGDVGPGLHRRRPEARGNLPAARKGGYRQLQGGESEGEIHPELLTNADRWILLKLNQAITEIDAAFAGYRFSEITQTLYRFFWNEYCDWYIESSKAILQGQDPHSKANTLAVIDFVLSHTLRLFHPFLPFITEELWHALGYSMDLPQDQGGRTIMFAHWPKPFDHDFLTHYQLSPAHESAMDALFHLITLGRNLRREFNLPSNKKLRFILKPLDPVPASDAEVIRLLLNAESLEIDPNNTPPKGTPSARSSLGELFLPLEGLIDPAAERSRLQKELLKINAEIEKVQTKLDNPSFVQKVPQKVLEEHQQRLTDWIAKRTQVQSSLEHLG